MIVSKNSPVYNQSIRGYRGYGLAPITLSPDSTSGGYPTTTAATTTTSGTQSIQTMSTAMQPIAVAAPIYTAAMPPPIVVDPQSPAEVLKRGGIPASQAWTLPSDKPWATVFDPDYYYAQYRDLQGLVGQQYGSNPHWLLWDHFVHSGIYEGRIASPKWSVQQYLANYPDLMKAYSDPNWWNHDPMRVLTHWFNNGIKENRSGAPLPAAGTPAATTPATPTASAPPIDPTQAAMIACAQAGKYWVGGTEGCVSYIPEARMPPPLIIDTNDFPKLGPGTTGGLIATMPPSLPVIPILLIGAGALVLFLKR
jgi:hypothetical protein